MSVESLKPGHFNHIALPSANPQRGAEFYCQVLGFRVVPRPAFSFDGRWLYRAEAGVMIHLIKADNGSQSHSDNGSQSDSDNGSQSDSDNGSQNEHNHDIAQRCPSVGPINTRGHHFAMQSSDVTRDLRMLAAHGVETIERILPDHGYRQVFFRDPDGNVVEIGEWPPVSEMAVDD